MSHEKSKSFLCSGKLQVLHRVWPESLKVLHCTVGLGDQDATMEVGQRKHWNFTVEHGQRDNWHVTVEHAQ